MNVRAEGKTYTFDPGKFLNVELIAIERATGLTALGLQDGLNNGSMLAATALIWTLRKRHENPQLTFDEVVFNTETFGLEFDPKEEDPDSTSQESGETAIPMTVPTGTESSSSVTSDSDRGSSTVLQTETSTL
jgi:hypothetical protein